MTQENMPKPQYVVREPHNAQELESLLRLRYREFHAIGMIPENPYALDLDYFDQNAYHIGLFREEQGTSTAIGTMRLVIAQPTRHQPMVKQIAAGTPFFFKKLTEKPSKPIAFFNYTPFPEALDIFRNAARRADSDLIEGSRYCIRKENTTSGVASFLMDGAIAICISYHPNYIWCAALRTEHEAWYRAYGFRRIAGTDCFEHPVGKACAMHSGPDKLPLPLRTRIENMRAAFEAHGQVYLHEVNHRPFEALQHA